MPLGKMPGAPALKLQQPQQVAKAAPNGTAEISTGQRATIRSTTTVKERGQVVRQTETTRNYEIEPDVGPHPFVCIAGHRVGQSIHYQTVETVVHGQMPVKLDPKAIKAGYKMLWRLIEEELDERAKWGAETIQALAQLKNESEGR